MRLRESAPDCRGEQLCGKNWETPSCLQDPGPAAGLPELIIAQETATAKTEWKILSKHLSLCLSLNSLGIWVDLTPISPNIKLPFHSIVVCSPLHGEVIFLYFAMSPPECCRGAQPVRHNQGAPHRQREVPLSSPWLWPMQSQPGMALTHVSSCSQSSVLIWEASVSTVLSPPCLLSVTSVLALPDLLLLNFRFLVNTQKAGSKRQAILKFV